MAPRAASPRMMSPPPVNEAFGSPARPMKRVVLVPELRSWIFPSFRIVPTSRAASALRTMKALQGDEVAARVDQRGVAEIERTAAQIEGVIHVVQRAAGDISGQFEPNRAVCFRFNQ